MMRGLRASWLLLLSLGCGGADTQPKAATAAPEPAAEPRTGAVEPTADEPAAAPGPWWWAPEPQCPEGEAAVQSLTWGRLVWCGDTDGLAAQRHRRDLKRLARCVREATAALQTEPAEGELAAFVGRAIDAEVAPALCGAVRRDPGVPTVSTHDGRAVEVQRHVLGEDVYDDGGAVLGVRYRFSCASCTGFAETTVEVAVGAAEPAAP